MQNRLPSIDELKLRKANDGDIIVIKGDGSFYYDTSSVVAPDDLNVVQAVDTDTELPGRWVRVEADKTTPVLTGVTRDIAARPTKAQVKAMVKSLIALYGSSELADLKVSTLTLLNAAVATGDTLDVAIGKLQGQINTVAFNNRAAWFQIIATNGTGVVECMGHSITYGYDPNGSNSAINGASSVFKRSDFPAPEQLQVVMQQAGYANITVKNEGYPGDRTNDGLTRWFDNVTFNGTVISSIPTPKDTTSNAIIMAYDFNDAKDYGVRGATLSLADFKTNYTAMVVAELLAGKFVLLNRNIPPIAYSTGILSDTYVIEQYASVIQEIALRFGLPFIDGRQVLQWLAPYTQSDGIHYKQEAYNFMGCQWAAELLLPMPRKVCAGDRFYYYDRIIPNSTNITPITYATKANTMMTLANGKNYPMVIDVVDRCELCIKSGGTSSFVVSQGNGNSGVADVMITTNTSNSLRWFRTGIICHPGKNIIMFKNASGASAFVDEISFMPVTDIILSRGKAVVPTDADYVVTSFLLGTWFRLPIITANRSFSLPTAVGREGEEIPIINQNTSGFTWSFLTTNVKTAGGAAITTIPPVIKLISDNVNWIQL